MPRREYRTTYRCAEPGCREVQFYVHSTREDEKASLRRQSEHPFKCSRHADPDRNLRPGNTKTTHILVAAHILVKARLRDLPKLFWIPEGGTTGSGFTFGPGFNAHADDFPEGTRLVVTAEIQMPGVPEVPQ